MLFGIKIQDGAFLFPLTDMLCSIRFEGTAYTCTNSNRHDVISCWVLRYKKGLFFSH